jgi:hypothetical protein
MRILRFTFKNEAIWMAIFACAPVVAGVFILLLVYLVRSLM